MLATMREFVKAVVSPSGDDLFLPYLDQFVAIRLCQLELGVVEGQVELDVVKKDSQPIIFSGTKEVNPARVSDPIPGRIISKTSI
jgi:hypothetical protein